MPPRGRPSSGRPWTLIKDEYKATKLLALWSSDRAVLMMREKPVKTTADLKGLTIGVLTEAQGETVKALGATPKVLPESALARSLKTGYVDGLMVTPVFLMSFDLGQLTKYYTVGPFPATVFFLAMNRKAYDALDPSHRAILDKATGAGMGKRGGKLYKNASAFSLGNEEKAGKTVIRLSPEEEKKMAPGAGSGQRTDHQNGSRPRASVSMRSFRPWASVRSHNRGGPAEHRLSPTRAIGVSSSANRMNHGSR